MLLLPRSLPPNQWCWCDYSFICVPFNFIAIDPPMYRARLPNFFQFCSIYALTSSWSVLSCIVSLSWLVLHGWLKWYVCIWCPTSHLSKLTSMYHVIRSNSASFLSLPACRSGIGVHGHGCMFSTTQALVKSNVLSYAGSRTLFFRRQALVKCSLLHRMSNHYLMWIACRPTCVMHTNLHAKMFAQQRHTAHRCM